MAYKPDYGLRLLAEGFSPHVDIFFYRFSLFSVTVLGRGQYSTMVEVPRNDEWLALSLDFNEVHLQQILSNVPSQIAQYLRAELARDPASYRTIDLPAETTIAVRARLGGLQHAQREDYVPLILQEVLSGESGAEYDAHAGGSPNVHGRNVGVDPELAALATDLLKLSAKRGVNEFDVAIRMAVGKVGRPLVEKMATYLDAGWELLHGKRVSTQEVMSRLGAERTGEGEAIGVASAQAALDHYGEPEAPASSLDWRQQRLPGLIALDVRLDEIVERDIPLFQPWEEIPGLVGQCFAFNYQRLVEAAADDRTPWHLWLMGLCLAAVGAERHKRPVLAGYTIDKIGERVIRIFLCAKPLPQFAKASRLLIGRREHGYIESGQDLALRSRFRPLAYWDPPATTYALWPPPRDESPGPWNIEPENELGWWSVSATDQQHSAIELSHGRLPVPQDERSTYKLDEVELIAENRWGVLL